jgi:hypothetical protein
MSYERLKHSKKHGKLKMMNESGQIYLPKMFEMFASAINAELSQLRNRCKYLHGTSGQTDGKWQQQQKPTTKAGSIENDWSVMSLTRGSRQVLAQYYQIWREDQMSPRVRVRVRRLGLELGG